MVLYCVPPCDSCYIPMTSNGSLFLSFFPAPVVDGDPTKPKRTSEGNKKTEKKELTDLSMLDEKTPRIFDDSLNDNDTI